ncbi:MAG: IPTL-CTERM sorting domain-containing protein, partial [Proteobacteria bacterium]|nr:IPTL-CTERM sorting domain-containing protein [Pseudomonadota bacterium]
IPASTVGVPITNINVSSGAAGGTLPYAFSATGLPSGITISAAGVISGAPTTAGAAGMSIITVTDHAGASASIYITYGTISPMLTRIAVAAFTVTEPIVGASPSITIFGCGIDFTCVVSWLPNDDPFQAGVSYTVEIELTAIGTNTFDSSLTATVNGQNANVTVTSDTTATVRFTFPPMRGASALSIPMLNPAMLALLALMLGGLAFRQRRRSV